MPNSAGGKVTGGGSPKNSATLETGVESVVKHMETEIDASEIGNRALESGDAVMVSGVWRRAVSTGEIRNNTERPTICVLWPGTGSIELGTETADAVPETRAVRLWSGAETLVNGDTQATTGAAHGKLPLGRWSLH
ncbi:polyprenyl synthetase [Platysternon megacephalum]|uniref:Polyprenyl synthetase n=1 Tax=Platysternon megacephalum TaxID=55544 RepID=A0A4D9DJ33_9SAUR|nr:polyprenyl synthetase [Platysternon megacephalum]